jgi:hypothetical protein
MDSQSPDNSLKETQNKYMNDQDLTANVVSLGGIVMTLAQFQTILTIAVLVTGLILNVVRIYETEEIGRSRLQLHITCFPSPFYLIPLYIYFCNLYYIVKKQLWYTQIVFLIGYKNF